MSPLQILPHLDTAQMADSRRRELDISRDFAAELGRSAVDFANRGHYITQDGRSVDWSESVRLARAAKISIAPTTPLPAREPRVLQQTRVQVTNETTLGASKRLLEIGLWPLALNFANGIHPGGGFLHGARAQEETLCRSSALYQTLVDDPMYREHEKRKTQDSTDWAIYSPNVPVFRSDNGTGLPNPWPLSFLTCAAPYVPEVGQPQAGDLLQKRILRVLEIAQSLGHASLVLGAWGCGAFKNDPIRTASDFRNALENEFRGVFSDVVFAVSDWSPDRRFLGPFRDVFSSP